ncbi:hypothetical protein COOONC_13617, partial [Cooperia oncophora]
VVLHFQQTVESVEPEHKEEVTAEAPKDEATIEALEEDHSKVGTLEEKSAEQTTAETLVAFDISDTPADSAAEEVAPEKPEEEHVKNGALENKEAEEASTTTAAVSQEIESESTPAEKAKEESAEQPKSEMVEEQDVGSPSENAVQNQPNAAADRPVNEARTNGIEKQPAPVIAELPGTVPVTKDTDDSVVKKIPSPPNEFIAHRLRREQEQRELDERKARIAAILAKSRNLSSATTPLVAGRTSPPRSESAQDVLKRLASNGNLPALQKLVARHATETAAIEQFSAPEDPAPQAI